MSGPVTLAMANIDPKRPLTIGRFSNGVVAAIMRMAPEKMPPAPIPCTTRPMIRPTELGAAPQTRLPSSKRPIAIRKTHLVGKRL